MGWALLNCLKSLQSERVNIAKRETETFNLIIFKQEAKLTRANYHLVLLVCMCHHLTNIHKSNFAPCISPLTLSWLYSIPRTIYLTFFLHSASFLIQEECRKTFCTFVFWVEKKGFHIKEPELRNCYSSYSFLIVFFPPGVSFLAH